LLSLIAGEFSHIDAAQRLSRRLDVALLKFFQPADQQLRRSRLWLLPQRYG
jgi:hypothetical protein